MGSKRKNKASHYAPRPESETASTAPLPPLTSSAGVPTFNLTDSTSSVAMELSPAPFRAPTEDDDGEWELPGRNKKPKKDKATKKRNYPEFVVSPQKLRRPIGLKDLQGLGLWLSADGAAPQWLLVRHKTEIRRVVVLMVPGFTADMFDGTLDLDFEKDNERNEKPVEDADMEENYFPTILETWKLAPCVRDMAEMFTHVWPIRAAGDDRFNKIHSPITSFLTALLPKNTVAAQAASGNGKRLKVPQLLMSLEELVENEYPLHSSRIGDSEEEKTLLEKRKADGWVETDLSKDNGGGPIEAGSILDGKEIYSIDCEMCQTKHGLELTRISVIDWDGTVVYDTLVKPGNEITDYLTKFSGITEELLSKVTTTLHDVQTHLLSMLNDDTVLVGQSLNSDLAALRLLHPHIIDTSVIYHHSRGPPYKPSLKWLSQRFLKREIQTSVDTGHSPIEDARACLDLLKLKLEKGETFGTSDDNRESIFKRLARPPHGPKKTAVVDYGEPAKWYGTHATHTIACSTDEGISKGMGKCVAGDDADAIPPMDFVWGRLRGLETAREFCTKDNQQIDIDGPLPELQRDPPRELLAEKVKETVERIREVYEALPKCTAFMVYSGTGDPRQWRRMLDLQRRFKEEYKVRNWDEVSVKWTDAEEQELRNALKIAKRGVGFIVVK